MPLNYDDGQSVFDNGTSTWDDAAQFPVAPAIGSQGDMFNRLKALIPRSWFTSSPNFDATLQGSSLALAMNWALIQYAVLQMRIKTAIDGFLDIVSLDYFGALLPRLTQESDASFRNRILANLFVKGPTRADMIRVLTILTGRAPAVFEPSNILDSGGYDSSAFFDCTGAWGDPLPYQSFVTAYRPSVGVVSLGEYDTVREWQDVSGYYSDPEQGSISDAAITAAVETTRALGTVVWLRIADNPVSP